MNTMKSVFSKIGVEKTELAKHEVNLGLIDDLNKALEDGESLIKEISTENKRISDLQKRGEKIEKEQSKLGTEEDKAGKKYFDLEDKFLKAKKDYEEAVEKFKRAREEYNSNIKEIEKSEKSKAPKVKRAQKVLNVFDKNLNKAKAAAKDLGLKLPVAKYEKAQENLRKAIS